MDLGLFKRRRFGIWLWIICPWLVAAGIHYSVYLYNQRMAAMLQEQKAMAALLPEMTDSLRHADDVVNEFAGIRATAAEARSGLTTRISELAVEHGFVANQVRIKSLPASGPMQKLEVVIEGEGRLLSIMKLVNDLQASKLLVSLTQANLRISSFAPVPVYNCELGLEAGIVPSLNGEVAQ